MPTATFSGLSYTFYNGDGSSTTYPIGFGFIGTGHVVVKLDGAIQTASDDYNLTTDSVVFVTPPASGAEVRINRVTPREYDERLVDFNAYGVITEDQMDLNQLQAWYLIQEAIESDNAGDINPTAAYLQWNTLLAAWDANRSSSDQKIVNVADPSASNDAATKGYVDDISEWGIAGVPQAWSFTAAASQTQYTLTGGEFLDANYLIVSIQGVLQIPDTDFTVNSGSPSSELVFTTAPTAGQTISIQNFGKARFLTTIALGTNSVRGEALQDGSVTTSKLASSAVTASKMAADAVGTSALQAASVTEAKLAPASVDYSKIKTTGFTAAPGGSQDPFLRVDRSTGDASLGLISALDLSDLDAQLANKRLSDFAVPNTALSMGGNRITSVTDPTGLQDAATKNYVDTAVGAGNGSKVVQVADITDSSTDFFRTITASDPAWLSDSSNLYYTVQVSNFRWGVNDRIYMQVLQGGVWYEVARMAGFFPSSTDYAMAWSFQMVIPRTTGTKPYFTPLTGTSFDHYANAQFGPVQGVRLRCETVAALAGTRFQVYGHRALS